MVRQYFRRFTESLLDEATMSDNGKLIFWLDFNVLQEAFYIKKETAM